MLLLSGLQLFESRLHFSQLSFVVLAYPAQLILRVGICRTVILRETDACKTTILAQNYSMIGNQVKIKSQTHPAKTLSRSS